MSDVPNEQTFIPVRIAAIRLGVPQRWLEDEAKAGRVPHIRAGRRILVSVSEVERALHNRASQEVEHAK